MSNNELLAIIPSLNERQLLSIEDFLAGMGVVAPTPQKPSVSSGMIPPHTVDGEVFLLRRYLESARCIMQDIMEGYFYDENCKNNASLIPYAFDRYSIKAGIVDDMLDRLDDQLEMIEQIVHEAIAGSEGVTSCD